MRTQVGNLAALTGHAIILHGVNGGWLHGPKFSAGFATDIARRDEGARRSYLEAWGRGPDDPIIYANERPWLKGAEGVPDGPGLPLGWVFPYHLADGVWLLHGVTQPYIRGTMRPVGKEQTMRPDNSPARIDAVRAVLDAAVRFMRVLAVREGVPRELHCTRLGCGLGGLEWNAVAACIRRVESTQNAPLRHPHLVTDDVRNGRQLKADFTVWALDQIDFAEI